MAKLFDVAESLKVKLTSSLESKLNDHHEKANGRKRRPWLTENENDSDATALPSSISNDETNNRILETDNKPATNREQSDNKVTTNRQQTENKVTTNREQSDNKLATNRQQTGNETDNKLATEVATNWQQTGNKLATKIAFSELVGLQRDIIIFISEECKNQRSRVTEALTLEYMSIILKRSRGAIKTTIQRLEKKGCLYRVGFKNGRGGWSRYEMPDTLWHEVLRVETGNKLATNWQQTDNKVATQPATEPATNPSSSSSKETKTTTTRIGQGWEFDVAPYQRFGFTTNQLAQLASLDIISAAEVEQSLIEFSYDLDNNVLPHIKTNKINFLMGLLRKGQAYVSQHYQNAMAQAANEMKARYEQRQHEQQQATLLTWFEQLDETGKKAVEQAMPTYLLVRYKALGVLDQNVQSWLKEYYVRHVVA